MTRKHNPILVLLILLPLALALGCTEKIGRVDQGRAIAYDKDKNVVTFIRDTGTSSDKPDYAQLPPVTYTLPTRPDEMGPVPKVGKRMKLDTQNRQVVIYVPAITDFATINYTLIDQKENVAPSDPLIFDASTGKTRSFPAIDKHKKTITIYSKRQKVLTTFSVPDEYFALPDDTWEAGDEVRVYFKEAGVASRFMNVSQTDIFKK